MCPHPAIYVSSYCYVCVLILLCMCPHTAMYVSACPESSRYSCVCYVCVRILLCVCPLATICVSACSETITISLSLSLSRSLRAAGTAVYAVCAIYVSSILLYMCPHTAICVLKLLYVSSHSRELSIVLVACTCMRPSATI